MLTYSAKWLCFMPISGNLLFGILQLGEVLTLWPLITRTKWKKEIEQHLVAFKKLLIGVLYWVKRCTIKLLNKIYTESLSKTDFTDNNYRSENLKTKVEIAANVKTVSSILKKLKKPRYGQYPGRV